nr:MAG TPA: hypothetical protein [Caudoviricetes sp.]
MALSFYTSLIFYGNRRLQIMFLLQSQKFPGVDF